MAVNVNFATANCNWVPRQENQAPSPTDFASLVWGRVEEGEKRREKKKVERESGLNLTRM